MLRFLVLLLLCSPAWATWTLVQHPSNSSCSSTSCSVTVASTGSGHLLVGVVILAASRTISSVTGGGTWVHCSNCSAYQSIAGAVDASYVLSSTAGATTVSFTLSASMGSTWIAEVLEYAYTGSPISLDDSNSTAVTTSSTTIAAPTLTLTGANDAIAEVISCGSSCSAGTGSTYIGGSGSPFTSPTDFIGGDGIAGAINTTTSATNWHQSASSTGSVMAIAFKETGAAPQASTMPPQVY